MITMIAASFRHLQHTFLGKMTEPLFHRPAWLPSLGFPRRRSLPTWLRVCTNTMLKLLNASRSILRSPI